MLDPSYIRDHMEEVRAALRSRGVDADKSLEEIATLETARRRIIPELEGLKRQQNAAHVRVPALATLGSRAGARDARLRARRPARRRAVHGVERRRRAPVARP